MHELEPPEELISYDDTEKVVTSIFDRSFKGWEENHVSLNFENQPTLFEKVKHSLKGDIFNGFASTLLLLMAKEVVTLIQTSPTDTYWGMHLFLLCVASGVVAPTKYYLIRPNKNTHAIKTVRNVRLRVLLTKLQKRHEEADALTPETLEALIQEGRILDFFIKLTESVAQTSLFVFILLGLLNIVFSKQQIELLFDSPTIEFWVPGLLYILLKTSQFTYERVREKQIIAFFKEFENSSKLPQP